MFMEVGRRCLGGPGLLWMCCPVAVAEILRVSSYVSFSYRFMRDISGKDIRNVHNVRKGGDIA